MSRYDNVIRKLAMPLVVYGYMQNFHALLINCTNNTEIKLELLKMRNNKEEIFYKIDGSPLNHFIYTTPYKTRKKS